MALIKKYLGISIKWVIVSKCYRNCTKLQEIICWYVNSGLPHNMIKKLADEELQVAELVYEFY